MWRAVYKLMLGLLLICPVCERGKIFSGHFTMRRRCPRCGVIFEREVGESTGGMAITLVVFSTIGIVIGSLLVVLTPVSPWFVISFFSVFTIVAGPMFYRHARGLWISILYLTGMLLEN